MGTDEKPVNNLKAFEKLCAEFALYARKLDTFCGDGEHSEDAMKVMEAARKEALALVKALEVAHG
jgi:hypothetical protein